jgi:hypothetical protein
MREQGFKREDIVEVIQHYAPEVQPEQEDKNWQRYAERVADYAFGVQGDLWLVKMSEERKQEQERQEAERRRRQHRVRCREYGFDEDHRLVFIAFA